MERIPQSDRYRALINKAADRIIRNSMTGRGPNWLDALTGEFDDGDCCLDDVFELSTLREVLGCILDSGNKEAIAEARKVVADTNLISSPFGAVDALNDLRGLMSVNMTTDLSIELINRGIDPERYHEFLAECEKTDPDEEARGRLYEAMVAAASPCVTA